MTSGTMRAYYDLAKPRMVYANLLVAAAAFMYASRAGFDWHLFVATLVGLGLVIAAACVFNNYYDRGIDAKMERTRGRALPSGLISNRGALIWCALLLAAGICILYFFTTPVALAAAAAGFALYTALYSPLKHLTPYALFVGALAGATPPLVGYGAVTNTLDSAAAWLFIFLFVWQLPHFLAIGVYRGGDYVSAAVPLFTKGPYTDKQRKLARSVFYLSLVVLLAWCACLSVQMWTR